MDGAVFGVAFAVGIAFTVGVALGTLLFVAGFLTPDATGVDFLPDSLLCRSIAERHTAAYRRSKCYKIVLYKMEESSDTNHIDVSEHNHSRNHYMPFVKNQFETIENNTMSKLSTIIYLTLSLKQ